MTSGSRVERFSEAFSPMGGMLASAAKRAVGKPALEFWDIVLRESVQNSWDARTAERIAFNVHARTLDSSQQQALRDSVLVDLHDGLADLRGALSRPMKVLVLSDEGTCGLGGPARADIVVDDPAVATHFRNFVFEIGRDSNRAVGAGTYGFGKGVLYSASSVATCLVYTRAVVDEEMRDRLIAIRFGSEFDYQQRRYTGRHWWGVASEGAVAPLEGTGARELAERIGLVGSYASTGTSIAILAPEHPETGESDLQGIVDRLRSAALEWAWPHLVTEEGGPTIDFRFTCDGVVQPFGLELSPQIQQFAGAYREALRALDDPGYEAPWDAEIRALPLEGDRPRTGVLVVRRAFADHESEDDIVETSRLDSVALMRRPRFVVKYLSIPRDPKGQSLAGVFVADDAVDNAFAAQEPVTHDDWNREPGRKKARPVAWTLDSIRAATTPRVYSTAPDKSSANIGGVAQLSRVLAENLIGLTGSGAEIPKRKAIKGGGGGGGSLAAITPVGVPSPVAVQGGRIDVDVPVSVRVKSGADLSGTRFRCEPVIFSETDGDSGEDVFVEVIGWYGGDALVATGAEIGADVLSAVDRVRVRHDRQVAVTIRFRKEVVA